ncbi:MAG: pitrilysin family protein [Nocardioides sp.]
MVVSAAGDLDRLPGPAGASRVRSPGLPRRPGRAECRRARRRGRGVPAGMRSAVQALEQVNVVLGVNGLTRADDDRFALGVLTTVLGGGTSSRLFQEVRERRGLAYSVYSFAAHHADAGLVGVSVGCLPTRLDEVLTTVRAELRALAEDGITEEELVRGKGQLRGGLVLGLEDTGSRMSRLGKAELVHDELLSVDEVLARIDAVTVDQIRRLARRLFSQPEILAVVGPR